MGERVAELRASLEASGPPDAAVVARLYDLEAELQSRVEANAPADPESAQLWVEALQLLARQPAAVVVPRDPVQRWRHVVDVAYCNDATITRGEDLVAAVEALSESWVGEGGAGLRRRLRHLVEDASVVASGNHLRALRQLHVRLTRPDDPGRAARIEAWEDGLADAEVPPVDPAAEFARRLDELYRAVVASRGRGPVDPWLELLQFAERHGLSVAAAKKLAWVAHFRIEGAENGYVLLSEALRLAVPADRTRLRLAQARIAGLDAASLDRAADLVELEVNRIRRGGADGATEVAGVLLDRFTVHLRPVAMLIWPADRAIELGRPDLARDWIELATAVADLAAARHAGDGGAVAAEVRIGLDMARLAMARWANAVDWPERLIEVVDEALQSGVGPGQSKQLLLFKAVALTYEYAGRRDRVSLADEAVDLAQRCLEVDLDSLGPDALALRLHDRAAHRLLAYLAVLRGDLGRAEAAIASARAVDVPAEYLARSDETLLLEAVAARLALDRGADRDELIGWRSRLEGALEPMLARAAAAPVDEGGVGFLHFGSRRAAISELIRLYRAIAAERGAVAAGDEAALRLLLRIQNVGTLSRRLGAGSTDLADARRLLPDDGAMLFYLPAVERSHLLVLDRREVRHFELPARDSIVALVQDLAAEVVVSPHGADANALAAIRASVIDASRRARPALLPDAAQEHLRDAHTWILVGTEMLDHPVFEALWLGAEGYDEHGGWLGTERALCYLPSVPLGHALARRREAQQVGDDVFRSVVIGAPEAHELESLDPALCERVFVTPRAGEQVFILGASATRGALRAVTTRDPDMLTVVAHGREAERGPGFVLTPGGTGGRVDAADLARLRLPPTVALLVCGAAKGPARRGDDTLNQLCDAAFRAGASTVVASSGVLAFEPTLTLVGRCPERLAGGMSPAEAMRMARAELVGSGATDHPFYFAQLRVFGLPAR